MFKRQIVKSCPVVKASRAVMRVPADLIREWNGLLRAEKDCEWLGLLTGKRSQDGLLIEVEGMIIPQDQERSAAEVKLPEGPEPDGVIGVIHSHHHMGARFSGIDWSTLNNRFWSSIVISYALEGVDDPERWWMGFDYEAVAQIKLPCGQLGMVEVEVEVVGAPDDMFDSKEIIQPSRIKGLTVDEPGDCPNTKIEVIDQWRAKWMMECGLEVGDESPIQGALGETTAMLADLPPRKVWLPAQYKGSGKGYAVVDKRGGVSRLTEAEERLLDTLSEMPIHEMTDEQFERWCELDDKQWDTQGQKAWAGEQWPEEDAAWAAYQRTYFDLQKEGEDV